jgi:hypothetical protein
MDKLLLEACKEAVESLDFFACETRDKYRTDCGLPVEHTKALEEMTNVLYKALGYALKNYVYLTDDSGAVVVIKDDGQIDSFPEELAGKVKFVFVDEARNRDCCPNCGVDGIRYNQTTCDECGANFEEWTAKDYSHYVVHERKSRKE